MPTPQPAPEPWRSLISEWGRSLRAENKSPNTVKMYVDVARKFHVWTDGLDAAPEDPADIAPVMVRDWIAHRLDTTSPGNANNNYRCLQAWFNWLLDEGEIDVHPMARMKPPHVPDVPPPVISDDLVMKVLAGCAGRDLYSRRDEAIIRLIWDTGARLSEIANLTVEDVDLTIDVINVVGKGAKPRAIPFSPKTGKAIGRYLRVRGRAKNAHLDALWLADRRATGLTPNGIKIMLRRRGKAAGVNEAIGRNLHAHLGRHSVAHHWQMEGGNVNDLMLVMGWTTPQMAARYGRSAATARAHQTSRKLRLGDRL